MKTKMIMTFAMVLLVSCSSHTAKKQLFPNQATIYPAALKGDLTEVLNSFVEASDSSLIQEQLELKHKYISRFITEAEEVVQNTNDLASEVILAYQAYWRLVLLQKLSFEKEEEYLYKKLINIVQSNGEKFGPYSEDEARRLIKYLQHELNSQGYKSLFGRTKPYLDLMLWKHESIKKYSINLGDDLIDVEVVMMDDFIVSGWLGYATFNQQKTGGWATKEKLFCVSATYDTSSEQFLVSYLAHEGRHFSDYKKFPMLMSVDLEYRAKLTELSVAETTLKKILKKFYDEGAEDPSSAHAYASFHVIKDLNLKLGIQLNPSTIEGISVSKIRAAANDLILKHTEKLTELGPSKTKGLFSE